MDIEGLWTICTFGENPVWPIKLMELACGAGKPKYVNTVSTDFLR